MKTILPALFLLLAPAGLYAQSKASPKAKPAVPAATPAPDPGEALNKALCNCFSRMDTTAFQTMDAFNSSFINCISNDKASSERFLSYLASKGLSPDHDDEAMEAAGREVGYRLTTTCPVVFRAMMRLQYQQIADSMQRGR